MDIVIKEIITNWGMFGVVLIIIGWLSYQNWKANKEKSKDSSDLKSSVEIGFKNVNKGFELINEKIEMVDTKVEDVKSHLNDRIDALQDRRIM